MIRFFQSHPFRDVNRQSILKRNMSCDYKFDDNIKVPQSCRELIASMLRANPKLRPSASEVLRHEFFSEIICEISNPSLQSQNDLPKSAHSLCD